MRRHLQLSPITLPILYFGAVILSGTLLLMLPGACRSAPLGAVDALFTATSATCVTGLGVVDTGSTFTVMGQTVILCLIQMGGLGIMTFTSIIFYLLNQRVSLTDRIAVGQSLLHDPSYALGRFLVMLFLWTALIEGLGAAAIHALAPDDFSVFSAVFHAVSAFCNAGFCLFPDSLVGWADAWGIQSVFMVLIVLGGTGFSVILEILTRLTRRILPGTPGRKRTGLSWYTGLVMRTTLFLIVVGWLGIYAAEYFGAPAARPADGGWLKALFQSVTCRTAGFNSVEIGAMTNLSLILMMGLMLIGGSSGSCAGGIKISTFRVLIAFMAAQLKGRRQAVIGRFAADFKTVNNALILVIFSLGIIAAATICLNITEGGDLPHPAVRGLSLEILFEVISAFGTVGLTMGLTPKLTVAGKLVIIVLMFAGRLGPILLVAAIQSLQKQIDYAWPENAMLIG